MFKILIFSPNALEYGRGGEISSIELAAGLEELYDISVIDTNLLPGNALLSNEVIENKLKTVNRISKIRFAKLHFFNKLFSFPFPGEFFRLYRIIKTSDIIYSSVGNIKINLMFIIYSMLHRRGKFIMGFRSPLHIEKSFSFYNIKYRTSILLFSLFKKKFYYHTISEYAKKFLEDYYDKDRITHVIHGVNLENYVKVFDKKKDNVLNFIYVGYLDGPHKGIDVLIPAIDEYLSENKINNFIFEFCGVGPLTSEVKKLENKFPEHVKYHGYVSNDKISEYYKRNKVFLFTSRREPFGRVIIEALAARLLILCSKTVGSLEILTGKEFAFFIRELSTKAIKNKIDEIYDLWLSNPKRFVELQESAKDYAFKNYSFSIELEMFNLFIKRILKS